MTNDREPHWQPLAALPMIAQVIDGMLASTQENHLTLQAARHRPYSLDDYTVQRTQKVYREQAQYLFSALQYVNATPIYSGFLSRVQGKSPFRTMLTGFHT